MAWECADCGSVEGKAGVLVQVVCHHCGKPLCQKHRKLIIDDAFSSESGPLGCKAYHCKDCKKTHHARISPLIEMEQ